VKDRIASGVALGDVAAAQNLPSSRAHGDIRKRAAAVRPGNLDGYRGRFDKYMVEPGKEKSRTAVEPMRGRMCSPEK
jgi:hypothetical protein